MLIAECVRPCPIGIEIKDQMITVVDTDDGVRERENSKKLRDIGLDISGLEINCYNQIIGRIYPILSYKHYEIEDILFIFKYNEVFAIRGNDSYMHIVIDNKYLYVNGVGITISECLGIPSRYCLNAEFIVNAYRDYSIVNTTLLNNYIVEKGVRFRIMRSILLS